VVACLSRLAVLGLLLAGGAASARDIVVVGLMADRAVLKVDGQTLLLKLGESVDDLTLTAVNASEARLRIGGREERFVLGQDRGGIRSDSGAGGAVELSGNHHGQFQAGGMINGRTVQFLIDTGASSVSMSRSQAARLGVDFRRFGKPAVSHTANGMVNCWVVLLDKVKVGPIVVSSVEATVRDLDDESPILLGMSFLGRVKMEHSDNRLKLTGR
jgi:aspartyl protease family protein